MILGLSFLRHSFVFCSSFLRLLFVHCSSFVRLLFVIRSSFVRHSFVIRSSFSYLPMRLALSACRATTSHRLRDK
ncbi:hypothetical protein C3V44_03070 [Capnocytophaga sp. oral taxon 864]|nr:hypothetical protein C3V44_03070 [Capnocytophaga sp. oral taxon 864]